jgi:hypothetical protein
MYYLWPSKNTPMHHPMATKITKSPALCTQVDTGTIKLAPISTPLPTKRTMNQRLTLRSILKTQQITIIKALLCATILWYIMIPMPIKQQNLPQPPPPPAETQCWLHPLLKTPNKALTMQEDGIYHRGCIHLHPAQLIGYLNLIQAAPLHHVIISQRPHTNLLRLCFWYES